MLPSLPENGRPSARARCQLRIRSGDCPAASDAALNSAVTFRQDQPTLSPLGPLFYGISQGIGAQQQGFNSTFGRKVASSGSPYGAGSGRVVR
jgi:hypothetical protein